MESSIKNDPFSNNLEGSIPEVQKIIPEKYKHFKNHKKKAKNTNHETYFYSTPFFQNNVRKVYKMTKNHYFVRLQNN